MYYIKYIIMFCLVMYIQQPLISLSQETKIKAGDVIEITVYDNDRLNQYVTVSPEGTVDFLFLKDLPVIDISLEGLQKILTAQLSGYMNRRPLITVRLAENYPVNVTVLGQVERPGIYEVLNVATIQGAISAAGGFRPGAQLSQVKLIRGEGTNKRIEVIDMEDFYQKGDPSYLPALKKDDTIVVPGNPLATTVKVLGDVLRPGSYEVTYRTSLLDAIYLAGGPTGEANMHKVKVVSPTANNTQEARVNLKDFIDAKDFQGIPYVKPGDIVHVPTKIVSWRKMINFVRDITYFGTLYVIVRWGRR